MRESTKIWQFVLLHNGRSVCISVPILFVAVASQVSLLRVAWAGKLLSDVTSSFLIADSITATSNCPGKILSASNCAREEAPEHLHVEQLS